MWTLKRGSICCFVHACLNFNRHEGWQNRIDCSVKLVEDADRSWTWWPAVSARLCSAPACLQTPRITEMWGLFQAATLLFVTAPSEAFPRHTDSHIGTFLLKKVILGSYFCDTFHLKLANINNNSLLLIVPKSVHNLAVIFSAAAACSDCNLK